MKGKKAIMEIMNIKNQKSKKSGFTLLELLVVISIIGILVAMGAAAYSTAQKSGRDARRQSDLKAYQNAQEQYYSENGANYTSATASNQSNLINGGYLNQRIVDPKGGSAYVFSNHTSTSYCVCALMESANGNADSECNFAAGTPTHFCVKNLQ